EVSAGKIEAVQMMGASRWQLILQVLVPEALPGLVSGATVTSVALVGYTAMAGAVGGGGLGALAISYGYQRYQTDTMIACIVLLVAGVAFSHRLCDRLARSVDHRRCPPAPRTMPVRASPPLGVSCAHPSPSPPRSPRASSRSRPAGPAAETSRRSAPRP